MRFKTVILALALSLGTLGTASAQSARPWDSRWFTNGLVNGWAWTSWSWTQQLAYMTGYEEALAAVRGNGGDTSNLDPLGPGFGIGMSRGDAMTTLDYFYANPRNLNTPVSGALILLSLTKSQSETYGH